MRAPPKRCRVLFLAAVDQGPPTAARTGLGNALEARTQQMSSPAKEVLDRLRKELDDGRRVSARNFFTPLTKKRMEMLRLCQAAVSAA